MRLIDADALYEKFKNGKNDTEEEKEFNQIGRYLVKHAPTIEPKRGEWKEYDGADRGFHYCSRCDGQAFNYDDGHCIEILSNFCPNCGADMRPQP